MSQPEAVQVNQTDRTSLCEHSAANSDPSGCLELADCVRSCTLAQQTNQGLCPSFNSRLQAIWGQLARSPARMMTLENLKELFPDWSVDADIVNNLSSPPRELKKVPVADYDRAASQQLKDFASAFLAAGVTSESYMVQLGGLAERFTANITLFLPSAIASFESEFAVLEVLLTTDKELGWCLVIPPVEAAQKKCYVCLNDKYQDLKLIDCRSESCTRSYHHLCAISDGSEAQGRCGPCAKTSGPTEAAVSHLEINIT